MRICQAIQLALKFVFMISNILTTNQIFLLRYFAVRTYVQCSLLDYLVHRGIADGPLFRMFEGCVVSRKMFSDFLSSVFQGCGRDSSKYKGHSFCTGAATFAASCGLLDVQIRAMERWNFDEFCKYIRLSNIVDSS